MANIAPFLPGLGLGALASGVGIAVVGYSEGSVKFEKKIISSSAEIISNYRELSCVKDLFPTVTWHAYPESETTKTKITGNTPAVALVDNNTKGCVSIRWQKETYSGGSYWRGAWNLIWVMRDEQYGTIFMSTITADHGIVQVDKYLYFLEKQNQKWTTTGGWAKDKETVNEENKSNSILSIGTSLPYSKNGLNLDNFVSQTNNVCPNFITCRKSSAYITVADLNWKYKPKEGGSESEQGTEDKWNQKVSQWIKDRNVVDFDFKNIYKNNTGSYELEEVVHIE